MRTVRTVSVAVLWAAVAVHLFVSANLRAEPPRDSYGDFYCLLDGRILAQWSLDAAILGLALVAVFAAIAQHGRPSADARAR